MRQCRWVHVGIVAMLSAASVSAIGLAQTVGATTSGTTSVYVPIAPCRLVDTRPAPQNVGPRATPIGPGESVAFQVTGTNGDCTVPGSATGIASNVTAVNPTAASYLTVYPADATPRPTASNLNYEAGAPPTPNQVTVGLSAIGDVAAYNNSGTVDIIIDIVGYYTASAGSGEQGPIGPQGPQGPQGAEGSPGPTCPAAGCTVVITGDAADGSNLNYSSIGCVYSITPSTHGYVSLDLPMGAVITKVTVRYHDAYPATPLTVYINKSTSPGVSTRIGRLDSINLQTEGDVNFTIAPTAVSSDAVYSADVALLSNAPDLLFCGLVVTYHL